MKSVGKQMKYVSLCLGLAGILILVSLWGLSIGTVSLPLESIIRVIDAQLHSNIPFTEPQGVVHNIVWLLRLPRIVLAMLVGAGLAVTGIIMQAIVKNPLADPYILGISSGASLGATAAVLLGVGAAFGSQSVGVAAFIGAFLISLGVLAIANIGGRANAIKLLLGGMALSAVCSAFASFIVYFENSKEGTQIIVFWIMGSLGGAKWDMLAFLTPIVLVAIVLFWTQSRILNLMLLGDDVAVTLGRDLHAYRQVYLLASSLVVGFLVYASGMIGFVGLLIPHIVRIFIGTDHNKLIPVSALVGAIFLVFTDGLSRILIPNVELPIGILISLVGAPTFVYLLAKKSYGFGGNQ